MIALSDLVHCKLLVLRPEALDVSFELMTQRLSCMFDDSRVPHHFDEFGWIGVQKLIRFTVIQVAPTLMIAKAKGA